MRLGGWLTLVVYILVFSLVGCAAGERFGSSDQGGLGDAWADEGCESDIECYDQVAGTYDFCDAYGQCHHVALFDTDPVNEDPQCDSDITVGHDMQMVLDVPGVLGGLSYTTPLTQGRLLKLSIRDPVRIRVRPDGKDTAGLMFVLLRDCANSAANRITWGPSIYSAEVDGGDYYLAVFSDDDQTIVLDIHFLEVTSCDDAGTLETGEVTGTTDGYADDFEGSCVPNSDLGEHRGDRVYAFYVPEGQLWNVRIDLYTGDVVPNHHLFLRRGCSGAGAVEIDCANEFVVSQEPLDSSQGDNFLRVGGEGLEPGAYYVFVDSMPAESYSLGEYHLEVEFSGVGPR